MIKRRASENTSNVCQAHSFPGATLSENCSLLGRDNVRGQIFELIIHQIFSLARDWYKRSVHVTEYSSAFKTEKCPSTIFIRLSAQPRISAHLE